MSQRITKAAIEEKLTSVNLTRAAAGLAPLGLSIWSPGDGWTRYQLQADDGARNLSRVCTAAEMYELLYTLDSLAWFDSERARR